MTSSNINKIVRSSNITLKPWILSKNTSEIVNTCIQKIYKQSQNSFKNDPTKVVATSKPENKAPIRALRSQERDRIPNSINVSRTKKGTTAAPNAIGNGAGGGASGVNGMPAAAAATAGTGESLANNAAANNRRSAVANLTAQRKLLKSSPNYKIYSSRRFGSSASSSNASIFRRNDERRRSTTQTAQLNYLLRTFATQIGTRKPLTSILPKFMVQARNQHIETRTVNELPSHMAQTATAIQRDLMPINSALKDRIAMGRSRMNKVSAMQKPKNADPLNGWHHPPSQEAFLARANQQRGLASAELQEQYRRLKNANRMRQFEHITQLENRHAILGNVSGSKTAAQTRLVDEFELDVATRAPRDSPRPSTRNQTPNFEQTYKTLLSRQQSAGIDPLGAPPVNISHITPAAAPPAATKHVKTCRSESKATTHGNTSTTQHMKISNEERCATQETAELQPMSAASVSTAQPAFKHSAEDEVENAPAHLMTISKKSATSQVLSRASAAAATHSNMRFNHSAHLKNF
ncbi:uncharacterized protein [Eurosta solidaginis]|uniref:uncharacterized protein n=1 Tax=Eurosta solidaginis TaxID=178769 RepID=UPI0035309F30